MDHLREGIGLQAYGQKDPLVEYKQAAFESFQDLTEDIQREIVRALLNVRIERVDAAPASADGAAPAEAAAGATAPPSPRADRPGTPTNGEQVPPARPAASAASGALARASSPRANVQLPAQPQIRNVVESSSTGTRRVDGSAAGRATPATGNGKPGKVGRNQPCPCGSGKKFKYCHGR
jgi:preprotein translocase subunit SecA